MWQRKRIYEEKLLFEHLVENNFMLVHAPLIDVYMIFLYYNKKQPCLGEHNHPIVKKSRIIGINLYLPKLSDNLLASNYTSIISNSQFTLYTNWLVINGKSFVLH